MKLKNIVLITLLLTVLTIAGGAVTASQDNVTADEISIDDNTNIESSVSEDIVAEDSYDEIELEKNNNEDKLSEEGEFIDVTDAYVYLNQFRNESGVWQWNSDDVTKTVYNTNSTNQLQPLSRDVNLEETAKVRAKELVESFSHTRPDGAQCFTAFPSGLMAMGENIAKGQSSVTEVTEAWKETNDPYSGQGHRRNMLSTKFNCVGIAGYKLNGVIYWVQDFGYSNNIDTGSSSSNDTGTNTSTTNNTNTNTSNINNTNTNNTSNNNTGPNNPTTASKLATKITAKKKIKIKAKKKSKYTITLKAGKTAVKKVMVYLKIGKKTIKAKTNNKGKATFKIKLKKKGVSKAKIILKGDNNYNKCIKKVKIIVK